MRRTNAAAAFAILLAARVAAADRITVKVVDVAGDTAYVEPGTKAGLVAGTKVKIGGRDYTVSVASDKTAALTLGKGSSLAIGDTGSADVIPGHAGERTEKLPPPKPLAEFKDQWPEAVRPATQQTATPVPLGGEAMAGSHDHLAVLAHMFGDVNKDGSGGQVEGRVVTSFDILHDRPLGADLDVAGRAYSEGGTSGSQTPLFVRAAQLRYGDPADPTFMLGRLRYAATSLGMLDGGRVATHVGNFELAAFGGLVPDPLSAAPTGASRFGVEVDYDGAQRPWKPHVAIVAHGSTWDGQLDERTLSVAASAQKGATSFDGWAEAQQFPAGNPWNAPAIDLTGAGASGEWRDKGVHLGLDVTFLRPERSLRIWSAFASSPSWVCALSPQRGDVTESCLGGDLWTAATASAGIRRDGWSIDAVGSLGYTVSQSSDYDASGYVRGELGHATRLVLAGSGGHSAFAAWMAADIGVAVSPSHRFDADLLYRPERLDYMAATGAYFMNSLVTDLRWAATQTFDVAVSAIGTTGADRDVLSLLTTLAWRPL